MAQWHERIKQFLPSARVGCIRTKTVDIENKDIVIAMLQSLSVREYDRNIFKEFGLVICDEAHHISSEVFSRALPKLSCRYTLGLSATPTRADGLTKVFKWYLGDILIKAERDLSDYEVFVERYSLEDQEENEIYSKEEFNFRGTLNSAKMLNKIAEFEPRNKLVAYCIGNIFHNKPKRKTLILSGRRQQLKDLELLLKELKVCDISYYVGGMSQAKLEESEKARVILSTYSMASEGLDIKSLNTMVLATPMSNVQQSVGRVLRAPTKETPPLIIDFVDNFSSYARQGTKRKSLYKKKKYTITDHILGGDPKEWLVNFKEINKP